MKQLFIIFEVIFGIPKTIFFNFKYLPFKKAIKLPIVLSFYCKIIECKGKIEFECTPKFGMIKIGIGNLGIIDNKNMRTLIELGQLSNIVFKGDARFGAGTKISSNGKMVFGENFVMTGNSIVICKSEIRFGENCLVSWKVTIMDTDSHRIFVNNIENVLTKPILFGDKVWICSNVMILKGVTIGDETIISAGSTVKKSFSKNNIIIGGNPGRIIKENISWEK